MADNRTRNYFGRLPTEVLCLILGEFCGYCRGSKEENLRDIYSGRIVNPTFRDCVSWDYCEGHAAAADRLIKLKPLFRWIESIPNTPPRLVRSVKSLSLGHGCLSVRNEQTWNKFLPVTHAYGLMDFMCWNDDTKPPKFTKLEVLEKLIMTFPLLTNLSIGECVTEWVEYDARFFQQIEELPLTRIDIHTVVDRAI
ncbi:hypothetical protein PG997_010947 [Apiospora hydei]|uniref:Uncharacterized protein n=1 Tax=Apiospora hydei TaxID=1337664 RepID=A0ABR1VLD7_9PEZI